MVLKTIRHFFLFPFVPKRAFGFLNENKPRFADGIFITILVILILLSLFFVKSSYSMQEMNDQVALYVSYELGVILGIFLQIIVYAAFVFAINSRWKKNFDFLEIYFYVSACFFPLLIFSLFPKNEYWMTAQVLSTIWFLLLIASVIHFKLQFSKLRSFAIALATYLLVSAASMMLRGIEI